MVVSFIGGENWSTQRKNTQVIDKLYHIMLYQVGSPQAAFKLTMLVVIGTDCMGSCKSIYHTITTKATPKQSKK